MIRFANADLRSTQRDGIPDASEYTSLMLSRVAKDVCSGLFVSKLPLQALTEHTVNTQLAPGLTVSLDVDTTQRLVRARSSDGQVRAARFVGAAGAVALPLGAAEAFFDAPELSPSSACAAEAARWPGRTDPVVGWDLDGVRAAGDCLFQHRPDVHTSAFLVAHRGRLVEERYGPGVTPTTQLPAWSMGKTLAAILIGRLLQQGELTMDGALPIREWGREGDPRRTLRLAHLLQMSSGLDFSATWADDYDPGQGYPDHS